LCEGFVRTIKRKKLILSRQLLLQEQRDSRDGVAVVVVAGRVGEEEKESCDRDDASASSHITEFGAWTERLNFSPRKANDVYGDVDWLTEVRALDGMCFANLERDDEAKIWKIPPKKQSPREFIVILHRTEPFAITGRRLALQIS